MIELHGVTKRFGTVTAVQPLDLSVAAGEFLTLVGPSGCGKTTLLRLLSGFEQPDAGSIRIDGKDVVGLPPYRRNLNQVFQNYALFPHLTVAENIAFGLRMQNMRGAELKARVDEAIALVELQGLGDRKPDQLSGGQRQRVALARAIAPRPDVVLLDEPLSALDAKLRQQVQGELKSLQRRLGMTFVFVTHDRSEALAMGDRIAVMNAGRLEQVGPPAEVYAQPKTAFVADFISEANLVPVERIAVTGSDERSGAGIGGATGWANGEGVEAAARTHAARGQAEVRVRLGCGAELELGQEKWPADAASAFASFRPENLAISKERPQGDGIFPAKIAGILFHGAIERLLLEANGGVRLSAFISGQRARSDDLKEGDPVWCRVSATDVVLLPADPP
jgi:spermidine/putrescine transport system ATP-binding protein